VLAHAELTQVVLPLLRADFAVCGTYAYRPWPLRSCPITAFGGLEDPGVSRRDAERWREQTTGGFVLRMPPGDHFFIYTSEQALLRALFQTFYFPSRAALLA
jgi:medium-chain acyl-[acyl-carrier-protein] hydrolase